MVVISDLFMDPETLKGAFQHLRFRKHDVAVFHLVEQNEIDFQFDRPIRFVDLEGGGPVAGGSDDHRQTVSTGRSDMAGTTENRFPGLGGGLPSRQHCRKLFRCTGKVSDGEEEMIPGG